MERFDNRHNDVLHRNDEFAIISFYRPAIIWYNEKKSKEPTKKEIKKRLTKKALKLYKTTRVYSENDFKTYDKKKL